MEREDRHLPPEQERFGNEPTRMDDADPAGSARGNGHVAEQRTESTASGDRTGTDPSSRGSTVVIPALDAASSTACLRSLGRKNVPTLAVSERKNPPGFDSKYTDEIVAVPDPADGLDAYASALLSLASRPDVLTIVPVREADIFVLAKHRDEFANHVATPWPDLETLRSVQDRVRLFEAAANADVGIPETTTLTEWRNWNRECIVKPRFTLHTRDYSDDVEESQSHSNSTVYLSAGEEPAIDELVDEMGHVPLVQEYVPDSDEYAFFALYDEGEAVATFQHRQRRGYKYSGGPSSFRESVDIPALHASGKRLLDELEWHGLAMVEFLRDPETGAFKLMEINPRFWTSLPFTVQTGVDFPYYYWLLAQDRADEIEPGYEIGAAGHLLRGELLYLHSIMFEDYPLVERPSLARAVGEIAYSLVRHPRFDYASVDDPKPFLRDCRNVLGEVVENRGRPTIHR